MTRYLNKSLLFASLFCVLIFIVQVVCMNVLGSDAIRQLGVIYMSSMSEQVASHFGTIIELRLAQVEALVDAVPPGRFEEGTPLQIELSHNALSAGFKYLAYYTEDEEFQMIYGAQVEADVPEALRRSIQGGKYNVCAGKDKDGIPVALMGVPAEYPVGGGKTGIGLVAGLPISYLSEVLEGSVKSSMVEYSIIRNDGSYVLHNGRIKEKNYFDRIEKWYETFGGKEPAEYAAEIQEALEEDKDYTSGVKLAGERWNVYCTKLPNSEWHLILKMSHHTLEQMIATLEKRWVSVSVGGCALILGALLIVFWGYFRLTKKQMNDLDEARKSAERFSRAKSEFLSNMSHDIRTPMNGIMGMTSIAIDNLDNPVRVRTCLKKINVSSRHLLGLLNDMLDMSKMESGALALRMEPVCLREIMQNIVTIIWPQVREKNQIFHMYVYDVYTENVCSDRVRLSQILLNILGNAVKFTPRGGSIVMELREEPSPKGDAYIRSCLHVIDNGIGMSEEFQGRIFDAFAREDNDRTDKEAGAGMGMTIAKHIVDAMEGTIKVTSRQGIGTDFYVALDMEKAVKQEQEFKLPERNVLVIDDDEENLAVTKRALHSIGLQAECVSRIEQAFEKMETCRQEGGMCHIVLLDWDIEQKNGIETAKELQRRFGETLPVVLFSDGENDELEAEAEHAGLCGVIAKPLFRSGLYYALRQFAEVKEPEDSQGADAADLAGRRILVAEDNEMNWEIIEALLTEFGAKVEWAENGEICVEKFRQSAPGEYDAVLMDIRMPVMTGLEAAKAIRHLEREDAGSVPIIAISADAFEEDIQKCLDSGMNAHTSKPMDVENVVGLLGRYLHKES